MIGDEPNFLRIAKSKGNSQFEEFRFRFLFYGGDDAVFAYPERFSIHLKWVWDFGHLQRNVFR